MANFYTALKIALIPKLIFIFFWGGLSLLLIGSMFNLEFVIFGLRFDWIDDFLMKLGSAILGAGVFAALVKTHQFIGVFQSHISQVFYDPSKAISREDIIGKWKALTNSLLEDVLPVTHHEAATKIKNQFFDDETEYHFQDYRNEYDITVDQETGIASVINTVHTDIILSPKAENPVLQQYLENEGGFELITLMLNDTPFSEADAYSIDKNNPNRKVLSIELEKYARFDNAQNIQSVKLQKIVKFTQNLKEDPIIMASIKRYVKGATILVRVCDSHSVMFRRFGLGDMPEENYIKDVGFGFQRWQLAEAGNLLLPGQGYIIAITEGENNGH